MNSGNGSVVVSSNNKSSGLVTSEGEIPVLTTVSYHVSEDYYNGNFRLNFWIDSIVGPAPYAVDEQLEFYSEPSISGPVTITTTPLISKVGDVTIGLLGSVEVPARTTFFAVGGAWLLAGDGDQVSTQAISISSTILQNKIAQNFPEYVDPVSKQDAATSINTTWKKLSSSPSWNSRQAYINQYNSAYGTQPDSFWSSVQIHHIRPRIYGGLDDFSNLMPVPNTNSEHSLITTWFVNY
ncbi:HNH endonuclease signature motif containing protein [Clostridium sp.]|uniref:HNH endonuclease signature motif containing protein n=1 Tax=Clostridium sp. TaxID=1506 RepID=UPI003FD725F2